ncbi:uncharacterized protein LOC119332934 [Triticum dicoccoides]|uniref:uncharacterized protein LOC119332934 n=1 Tax=Triticum dicoccoides TaxID=85692 RepID=UPI001891A8ED|nr:uncharacterized protein LOC119332934 [Triticum dicoccoides]
MASVNKASVNKATTTREKKYDIYVHETVVCCQGAIYDLLWIVCDDNQRKKVAESSLQGLLHLRDIQIRRQTVKADTFDPEVEAFIVNNKQLKIHLEDVVNIMDLPSAGGIPDIKLRYADKKLEFERKQKQGQLFRLYVDPKEQAITYKGLVQQIRESKGSTDEHFLRRIALCVICRLLCPSTKSQVSSEYLNLMLDDGDVNKINWATLTLDHLIACLKQYKNNKQTNLAGNLALLQVWYWEKFYVNKVKHNIDIDYSPRQKPLIQSWDKEKVAKREHANFAEGDVSKGLCT